MPLFQLEDLAALLQSDLDTATAETVRDIATGMVVAACGGQNIESAAYSHVLPVGATGEVTLPQWPVTAVTSVTVDGTVLDSSRWEWREPSRTVALTVRPTAATVAYTAGYATVPAQVKAAALTVAARVYRNASGVRSEAVDDYRVDYGDSGGGLSDLERMWLRPWRTPGTVVPA